MDRKEIKKLIQLMIDNDLTELEIADGDSSVHLKRHRQGTGSVGGGPDLVEALSRLEAAAKPLAPVPGVSGPGAEAPGEDLIDIRSPMVGTYYSAASPDSDPYVTTGTKVTDDTVVAIVEAMKVMNEIKAECSGTITEVCVENVQPVEYGQVLFRVRPG